MQHNKLELTPRFGELSPTLIDFVYSVYTGNKKH